jgi:hypothetical protein
MLSEMRRPRVQASLGPLFFAFFSFSSHLYWIFGILEGFLLFIEEEMIMDDGLWMIIDGVVLMICLCFDQLQITGKVIRVGWLVGK